MFQPLALLRRTLLAVALQMLCICGAAGADEIRNVATLTWKAGEAGGVISSNAVVLDGPARVSGYTAHGFVFEHRTGRAVSGVRISLVEHATGRVLETVISGEGPVETAIAHVGGGNAPLGRASLATEVWLEGAFAFSPAPSGIYHLLIVPPKGMRVATDVPNANTSFTAPDGTLFDVSTGSRGEPFELASYLLLDLDIPIEPTPPARLSMEKTAGAAAASLGDLIEYQIRVRNESADGPAFDVSLEDVFPPGFSYVGNSLVANGVSIAPTLTSSGMRAMLGDIAPQGSLLVAYYMRVGPGAPLGQAMNRATVTTHDGATSASGDAAIRIEPPLMADAITIVGRVTSGDCAAPQGLAGVRVVMQSGAYAITDSRGFYHFEGVRPGAHVVQMDVESLPDGARPAACGFTTRRAGSNISQFVEASGGLIARADFHVTAPTTTASDTAATQPESESAIDLFADQQPGIGWVLPVADTNPRAPALRVAIKHGRTDKVQLSVNGKIVPSTTFEGIANDSAGTISISQWRGVAISDGDNALEAIVISSDGVKTRLVRVIHYANIPARAVLVAAESRLIADGASRPVIATRILDAAGKPVRAGVTGGVRISSPYRLAAESEAQQTRQLAGTERFAPVFRVVDDTGLALIELDPTTTPGWAELVFDFPHAAQNRPEPVRAWLSADREEWIVVGFAAGTAGFDTLAGHAEDLPDGEGNGMMDGQAALYAKGRIMGRWLLTLAYDSTKRADDGSLLSVIDPDRYYSLYGDASTVGYDAASAKKLYLRLERDTAYAMFGDFETGFTDTQLSRYSRTLTGFKAESAGKTVNAAVFTAKTTQRSIRDEIPGNGLSGPYRLSTGDILANTDHIRIETRDRLRSERVLQRRDLVRHIDYEVDYAAGSIAFRQPVLSKDADFNPVYIVAEYETWGAGVSETSSGARVTANLNENAVRIGVTAITDEQVGNGRLAGVDLVVRLDQATTIRLEGAVSDTAAGDAGAWLAEVQRTDSDTELLAYARRQEQGFGLGQAPLGQAGSEKAGVDLRRKLSDEWNVVGSAWRERALETDAERINADVRVEHRTEDGAAFFGGRVVADSSSQESTQSNQLLLGISRMLMDRRLEVTETSDINIDSGDESRAFPTRHRLSTTYAVTDTVRVSAGYELTPDGAQKGSATQIGLDVQPWDGARLSSTLRQTAIAERGERTFAQYGLSQSLPLGDRWTVDASYDSGRRVSGQADEAPAATAPISTGAIAQQDFDAVTAGATYRAETWSINGRLEYRTADDEDRIGLVASSINQLSKVTSVATSFRSQFRTDRAGREAHSTEGRASAAIRPTDSAWTLLARTTVSYTSVDAGVSLSRRLPGSVVTASETLRLVTNVSANFDAGPTNPWTGSVYYGAKYVFLDTDQTHLRGRTDILGGELRYDINETFDVGFAAALRRQASTGQMRFTAGPSLGWSPMENVWLSVGYNVVGFRDRDFEDNRYTRKGAYLTFRFKFDQTALGLTSPGETAR